MIERVLGSTTTSTAGKAVDVGPAMASAPRAGSNSAP
jgi:hypothetical protein